MKRTIALDKETYLYLLRVINRSIVDIDSAVAYVSRSENAADKESCPSYYNERFELAAEQPLIRSLYDAVLFGE